MSGYAIPVEASGTRRPRVLHLIPADGIGGVEEAARSMRDKPGRDFEFRLQFIERLDGSRKRFRGIPRLMAAHSHALRTAQDFRPDLIVCSLWRSVPVGMALRILSPRTRLVYFLHAESPVHACDALMSALAIRAADQIWADSEATLLSRRVKNAKGRVISFVTAHPKPVRKEYAGPSFVSWGRLDRQKGFDRAIRLIALLVAQGIDARYDIYGPDSGARVSLASLIEELGVSDRVRLLGPIARERLPDIAAGHAFFLQPSRFEGMCMAAVEAMQLGLVPVATPVGQMASYVLPGRTGVIFDPDDMDATTIVLRSLISDPEQWRLLSDAAVDYWLNAPLYSDDFKREAARLLRVVA